MSYIWSISGLIFLWTPRLRESTRVLSKSAYCNGGDNNLGLIVIPKDAAAQRFAVNDSIVGRPSNRFIAKVFLCILQWFFYFYCLFLFFPGGYQFKQNFYVPFSDQNVQGLLQAWAKISSLLCAVHGSERLEHDLTLLCLLFETFVVYTYILLVRDSFLESPGNLSGLN